MEKDKLCHYGAKPEHCNCFTKPDEKIKLEGGSLVCKGFLNRAPQPTSPKGQGDVCEKCSGIGLVEDVPYESVFGRHRLMPCVCAPPQPPENDTDGKARIIIDHNGRNISTFTMQQNLTDHLLNGGDLYIEMGGFDNSIPAMATFCVSSQPPEKADMQDCVISKIIVAGNKMRRLDDAIQHGELSQKNAYPQLRMILKGLLKEVENGQ